MLMGAAINELLEFPDTTPAELVRELDALDSSEIRRRMLAALESALLRLPPTCPPPHTRFHQYPAWSRGAVEGRSFRTAAARFPWSKGPRLVVGDSGASLVIGNDRAITVEFGTCAVAVLYPGEVLEMYGRDGFRIRVEPEQWREGGRAVASLLELLPGECVLRIEAQTR
jgi:hypothetical protein